MSVDINSLNSRKKFGLVFVFGLFPSITSLKFASLSFLLFVVLFFIDFFIIFDISMIAVIMMITIVKVICNSFG